MRETDDVKKVLAARFGGLRNPPKQVYRQTKPPEPIRYGHAKDWHLYYYQLDEQPLRLPMSDLRETNLEMPLNTSTHTLYRHEWAVQEWVTTEPPTFNVETETLTFHGYYRIHVFDVWLTEAEEAVREKGDGDGE